MKLRWLALFILVPLAGCSKIHEQRSFTVEPGGSHSLQITAPLSEQKLQIVLTSDQPVNIWVVLEKNIPEGKDEFDPETLKEGVVAKEKAKTEATLTATIPAKEKFRVYIDGVKKKASVTVKIDSQ
jgi:hypothetical protein